MKIIEQIIESLGEAGPKSYFSFETYVLNILKHHISQQGNELKPLRGGFGDAYAPNGFDSFEGPTLIEIKFHLDRIPPRSLFEQIISSRVLNIEELSIKHILIISARPISEDFLKSIINYSVPTHTPPITIWGPDEMNKVVAQHRKESNEIARNLFALKIKSAVNTSSLDWRQERELRLKDLRQCYLNSQFSLFLGAGVSSSAGMPNWNTLLQSLLVSFIANEVSDDKSISDKDITEIVNRLQEVDGQSALMSARYLRKGFTKESKNPTKFYEEIAEKLYKKRDTKFPINSKLLQVLASMCIPKRSGARVQSVITYNFDDLFERELKEKSIDFHSIYQDSETYTRDELPIYHVHGFLPEDSSEYKLLDQSKIVFSEEGYHEIYTYPYHWSNLVQLNNLRENNCLMVGLSLTDPNLRRLLDISGAQLESPKHFAFLMRTSEDYFSFQTENDGSKVQLVNNLEGAKTFLGAHHSLHEEIMRELGVTIIWYQDYLEVPLLLETLLKSNKD